MRGQTIAAVIAAALMGGSGGKRRGLFEPARRSMWHDPARVEAAAAKRDRRAWRDIAIAHKGGIGFTKSAQTDLAANGA